MGCYSFYNVSTNVGAYTMSQDRCDLICIDAPRAEALRERLLDEDTALEAAERAKALSESRLPSPRCAALSRPGALAQGWQDGHVHPHGGGGLAALRRAGRHGCGA